MNYEALLRFSADLGVLLQESGAEIYRVEETVSRLIRAYGVEDGEVFAIPSCLIVGLTTPEGESLTRMRRIAYHGTDVYRIERINELCRALCNETPPFAEAVRRLEKIRADTPRYATAVQLFGYFLACGALSLFFGGNGADAMAGGLCGMVIGVCLLSMSALRVNSFFKTLVAAFVSGLLAFVLVEFGFGNSVSAVKIGALMALVPGIGITNCIRDIMAGDLMTGLMRMLEAVFIGVAIALGSGAAIALSHLWI